MTRIQAKARSAAYFLLRLRISILTLEVEIRKERDVFSTFPGLGQFGEDKKAPPSLTLPEPDAF